MSLVVAQNLAQASGDKSSKATFQEGASMSQFLNQWLTPSPKFGFVSMQSPCRAEVEQYIGRNFEASYGARLAEFLPIFLTLRCNQNLSASTGISPGAISQNFFLEQYLDAPIETELQQFCDEQIAREQLVEIGNLVATTRGASRLMFIILASVLNLSGFKWMVFTATKPLLSNLRKLGFETLVIADAKPSCLSNNANAAWGSYYDNQPQVVAGNLSNAQEIVDGRNIFSLVQSFYKSEIDSLAQEIKQIEHSNA
jgi:hypothetical protein